MNGRQWLDRIAETDFKNKEEVGALVDMLTLPTCPQIDLGYFGQFQYRLLPDPLALELSGEPFYQERRTILPEVFMEVNLDVSSTGPYRSPNIGTTLETERTVHGFVFSQLGQVECRTRGQCDQESSILLDMRSMMVGISEVELVAAVQYNDANILRQCIQ